MMLELLLTATLFQQPVEASGRRAPPAPAVQTTATVTLRRSALARGLDVRLGDLVTVEPAGPLADQIEQIVFGNPPTFGFVRQISVHEIRNRIAGRGLDPATLEFTGASSVTVRAASREVKVTELQQVTDAVLSAVLENKPGEEVEFELTDTKKILRIPPGRTDLEYEARVRPGSINQTGAIVDVTFIVDGIRDKKIPLRYDLARYQYIVKTVRTVRRGEPLDAGNLVLSRERVGSSQGYYATRLEAMAGLVAKRDLQKGKMVSIHDGEEPDLIRPGDLIDVISTRGNVEITMTAKAVTGGSRKEAISVQRIDGKTTFRAIVLGPGLAAVGPTVSR